MCAIVVSEWPAHRDSRDAASRFRNQFLSSLLSESVSNVSKQDVRSVISKTPIQTTDAAGRDVDVFRWQGWVWRNEIHVTYHANGNAKSFSTHLRINPWGVLLLTMVATPFVALLLIAFRAVIISDSRSLPMRAYISPSPDRRMRKGGLRAISTTRREKR